ncbi:MAG: penicillin-binding protein 2 [Firmicutes bacterium]|nr:penicillin-binding protein 2 [Bacillota bacterium]
MEKIKKRVKLIITIFSILLFLLGCRIWYIQVVCHDELTSAANSQYYISLLGLDTRGNVLDRNLKPLTGGTQEYYYIINKNCVDEELGRIMDYLSADRLTKDNSSYFVYRTEIYNSHINEVLKTDYDAYVFENQSRYADEQPACHLIGYLNEDEQRGVSGLELLYQRELEPSGNSLAVLADAAGNILNGLAPTIVQTKDIKNMTGSGLVTTIDRRLQHICEQVLKQTEKDGAILVMDSDNGEILAWASAPTFNPNDIESHLYADDDCLVDKVCQGTYASGSVFKIVTAAAALESGKADIKTEFLCSGKVTVEGVEVNCSTGGEKGHGKIDMKEAMAQSCNCYFVQLGEQIGCTEIIEMARTLGFGEKCFDNFPGEASGYIPYPQDVGPWDTTNLSIGQGDILVTPLQTARVTSLIANGGMKIEPKLIMNDAETEKVRVIKKETAGLIDEMLKEVMKSGTGAGEWKLPVGGKTGTAEAFSSGENINNCWFTGYFTSGEKTYVVTVLIEDGLTGSSTAIPVFKPVYNYLADNL